MQRQRYLARKEKEAKQKASQEEKPSQEENANGDSRKTKSRPLGPKTEEQQEKSNRKKVMRYIEREKEKGVSHFVCSFSNYPNGITLPIEAMECLYELGHRPDLKGRCYIESKGMYKECDVFRVLPPEEGDSKLEESDAEDLV